MRRIPRATRPATGTARMIASGSHRDGSMKESSLLPGKGRIQTRARTARAVIIIARLWMESLGWCVIAAWVGGLL